VRYIRKITAVLIAVVILAGTIAPSLQPSFAANNVFNPSFKYNDDTGQWEISWTPITGATKVTVLYHEPDGQGGVEQKEIEDYSLTPIGGRHMISLSLGSDHIYDLTFSFKNETGNTVKFKLINSNSTETEKGTVYFLAGITFTGTSFNDIDEYNGIEDFRAYPENDELADKLVSGSEPQITLRWKVPTIYYNGSLIYVTDRTRMNYKIFGDNVDFCYFRINMTEISEKSRDLYFQTQLESDGVILRGTDIKVEGFNSDGNVTEPDGEVRVTLDSNLGNNIIKPGTEYANVSLSFLLGNENIDRSVSSQVFKLGYETYSVGFPVVNMDYVFSGIETDSIFTPVQFEIVKVDTDKIEVRVKKINKDNNRYPALYYQVHEARDATDILTNATLSGGIKMPESSIPDSTDWGSIIVEIDPELDNNGRHKQRFYRVVVTDSSSQVPFGSLAVDISKLNPDTGKPPVPREVEVQTIYEGRKQVEVNGTKIEIPITKIRVSFEKPLFWDTMDPDKGLVYHVLLSTYLSGDENKQETKELKDKDTKVTVNLPVTEKRVAVIGKNEIKEDPVNRRLYFELGGSNRLFCDYTVDPPEYLDSENEDNKYPLFLVPNTKYYLRMFSTWNDDKDSIDWGKGNIDKISYISPAVSFTTYPSMNTVPVPNFTLEIMPENGIDEDTGLPRLDGIRVGFDHILARYEDWDKYTTVKEERKIEYELLMSTENNPDKFQPYDKITVTYSVYGRETDSQTEENGKIIVEIKDFPKDSGNEIKPNTTYYFKMKAALYVKGETEPFITAGTSDDTPVKSITTPKIDTGRMDDLDRVPRTPVEFSVATDENGEPEVTDTKVVLTWLHAESDVTYEMVCTVKKLDPDAKPEDYEDDPYNKEFLEIYKKLLFESGSPELDSSVNVLNIDISNKKLYELGFTYDAENSRWIRFPITRFLKPNRIYYFSIRAVRDRDTNDPKYSKWVSIPVTTKMIAAPRFLEAVADVQLGFNVELTGDIPAENLKVMIKKSSQSESAYTEVPRTRYSVVKYGNTYYFRIYDLEPDTWYDILPFYKNGDQTLWYNVYNKSWTGWYYYPIQMKTRNTMNEIEIRFEGEEIYGYGIEVRTDDDEDYQELYYSINESDSDYGYTLKDGTRIQFYKEKTIAYVNDTESDKYMYYVKISQALQRRSDGTKVRKPLLSNTRYYVRIWAIKDGYSSKHIGPVTIRTDFSQKDYDDDHKQDEIRDIFESKADKLTKKLYFTVDEQNKSHNRVLLKGAMISNLMRVSGSSGVTVDISKEKPDVSKDIVIIPMEIIETLQTTNSRLTVKFTGGELVLTADTINPDVLNRNAGVTGVKETMLEITVQRKAKGSALPELGFTYASQVYDIGFDSLSMRMTYTEINNIIYDILKKPEVSGPFKYGILDRELKKLLENESILSYQSYSDLEKIIELAVERVEEELSSYIKDILDGGRGFSATILKRTGLTELTGGVKLKIIFSGSDNLVEPYVLPRGSYNWTEPTGIKGWLFPYMVLTAKIPGEYAVFSKPTISLPETGGFTDPALERFSKKYDLIGIFGNVLYPGDLITGENAVKLYEAVTGTSDKVKGLSTAAKVNYYGIGDIIPPASVKREINKGQADSLAVEIYAFKTGVHSKAMSPSSYVYIKNADQIPDPVYRRVVIALDLGITGLEPDRSYNADKKVTVEELIKSVITVLEILGEW